jgi:hypothetical protein
LFIKYPEIVFSEEGMKECLVSVNGPMAESLRSVNTSHDSVRPGGESKKIASPKKPVATTRTRDLIDLGRNASGTGRFGLTGPAVVGSLPARELAKAADAISNRHLFYLLSIELLFFLFCKPSSPVISCYKKIK